MDVLGLGLQVTSTRMSFLARGQREELRPWQRSWGRRLGICKGVIKPQETPCSRASTPKPVSVLCSHLHLWLYGGLSPITVSLREGVNVQLQDNKNSWVWQECFSSNLLWRLSSPPVQVRPATCDCLQPPNLRGTRCFRLTKGKFFWGVGNY